MCKKNNYAGSLMFCCLLLAINRITGQLHEKYIGCFVDNGDDQEFEPVLTNQSNLTIEMCILKCYNETNQTKSEVTFAALTNGRRCTCRNNVGQQLLDLNCNVKCSGDKVQNCGGNPIEKLYSLYTVCPVCYFGPNCDQLCNCKRHLPCDRQTGICPDGCNEEWTGTSCNISNIQKQYIGCYGDGPVKQRKQAMDVENPGGKTGYRNNRTNSIEFCIEICATNNYTYGGMQYGYDCYCGEKYNRYGNKTYNGRQVNCDLNCTGNGIQICGGDSANSVYYVCPLGFYGRNCTSRCHCDGNPCRFNGSCLDSTFSLCKPGWTGSACNIRDCGINNGQCESDEMCENVDLGFANSSVCRCKSGFYRDSYTCRPTSLRYVGCYKGKTTQYAAVDLPSSDLLTIEFCILECSRLNRTYSIIQGGVTCLCGDDYGRISPDDECQVPCIGNHLQYCGGTNATDGIPNYAVYTAKSFLRQYIGCYKDTWTERAMERESSWHYARKYTNTIESCTRLCVSRNYTYAGLQYSYQCFCGDSYDKYGPLNESSCNMRCAGNENQTCGGPWANSVYAVNDIHVFWCSSDRGCKRNESCNVIDLNYMNVSRCRCQQGFHRMSAWEYCTDVDECQSGESACAPSSENCFNDIGSYRCECKNGFVNVPGRCEDIDECSDDSFLCDNETELCRNTIGSYLCHCKSGYENMINGKCSEVDECQLDGPSSPCNANSEYCVNSIGSYICSCKKGFTCGRHEECNNTPTTGIILGTFLAISLLINALFVVSRIKNARPIKPEPSRGRTKSDLQPRCVKISDQQEMTYMYDEIPDAVGQNSVYEQINLDKRQIVQNPTSEYAALKHDDDYLNVESSS